MEHTITEEITGIDIVQSQMLIASGKTLPEIGLTQDSIPEPTMYAMVSKYVYKDAVYQLHILTLFTNNIHYASSCVSF